MSQLTADFFAFPGYACRFPDNPSKRVDYRVLDDLDNPFTDRYFISSMSAGEAPSFSEMAIEWTIMFGDRPFLFCSLDDLPGPPVGKERYMWECHISSQLDFSFEKTLFAGPMPPWPEFRYVFVRLSAAGDWPFTAWFLYAVRSSGDAYHRDMLGFSFGRAAV